MLVALGIWQIDRGEDKAALIAQRQAALQLAPPPLVQLSDDRLPPSPRVLRVQIHGRYLPHRQLLMQDQSNRGEVGYDVLTPLRMDDGRIVVVNRGWVPMPRAQPRIPNVAVGANLRTVVGLWRHLAAPGLRLDAHNCREQPWPRRVSYPDHADLTCLYGPAVRRGVVELDPRAADGYVRHWTTGNGFPPIRHYAYAVQWFAFCLVAVFLFFRLNLKPVVSAARAPKPTKSED